jgi:hypothetical protein
MVRIFGAVEMLSPACSRLGLDSYLALYLWSPCQLMLIPVVCRIVIWGDRFGTAFGGILKFRAMSGGF